MSDSKKPKKPVTGASVNRVVIWDVHLFNGDWYYVFARSEKEALRIVIHTHYEMRTRDFRTQFAPKIRRVPDGEKILVNDEDRGQQKWTAKRWAKGERPGPFCSNTYAR